MKVKKEEMEKLQNTLKGQVNMAGLVVGALVLVIVLTIAAIVVQSMQDSQTSGSAAYNVTVDGLTAMTTGADLLTPLVIVGIAVVILGLLAIVGRMSGRF